MTSAEQLDHFLADLDGRRRRLTELLRPEAGELEGLRTEITALGEQLLVADEELRVQQEQLDDSRVLLESGAEGYARALAVSPHPLVITDETGAVRRASRGALTLVQRSAHLTPRPIATWFAVDDRSTVRRAIWVLHRSDEVVQLGRLTLRRPDRSEQVVAVTVSVAVRDGSSAQLLWHLAPVTASAPALAPTPASAEPARLHAVPDLAPRPDADTAERLTALTATLGRAGSLEELLAEAVRGAAGLLPYAGAVDLVRSGTGPPGGARHQLLLELFGKLQSALGEGPTVDALNGTPVRSADVAADARWPRLAERVAPTRVRSALVVPVPAATGRPAAALLWADAEPAAFDEADETAALWFAVHTGLALERVQLTEQLRSAASSRQQVGQALGILIERYRLTPESAFALLRRLSSHANVKVRDLAARLTETGELPGLPAPTARA